MDKKYKVTQVFMDQLLYWQRDKNIDPNEVESFTYVSSVDIKDFPTVVERWWVERGTTSIERNNRLITIIQWLNGEDVFEVEKPHKFVVRSDKFDHDGDYTYVLVENNMTTTAYTLPSATKFDTREEAQEWANSHQVVVEIDGGNEHG